MPADEIGILTYVPLLSAAFGLCGLVFGLIGMVRAGRAEHRAVAAEERAKSAEERAKATQYVSERQNLMEALREASGTLSSVTFERMDRSGSYYSQIQALDIRLNELDVENKRKAVKPPLADELIDSIKLSIKTAQEENEKLGEENPKFESLVKETNNLSKLLANKEEISPKYSVDVISVATNAWTNAANAKRSVMYSVKILRMAIGNAKNGIEKLESILSVR